MKRESPLAWQYLSDHSTALRGRESGRVDRQKWHGYIYEKNLASFEEPKLIVQVISKNGRYAFDDSGLYFTGGGNGPYYGLRWASPEDHHSIHYLQGLLNSPTLDFVLHKVSTPFRGGYWSYGKRFIEQLPIRTIDFDDPADVERHDRMVSLVQQMLDLHQQLDTARTDQDKRHLQRLIDHTDREIDSLVYDLYDLTEEEIAIVEGEVG